MFTLFFLDRMIFLGLFLSLFVSIPVLLLLSGTSSAAPYMFGVTIDDPWTNQQAIHDALASHTVKPTVRVVFDENVPATEYIAPVANIHSAGHVMGEILDSFYVADYTVQQYLDRTAEYLDTLVGQVDIWEIGNEVNGDWLGDSSDVKDKIAGAYALARAKGVRTALNFYYNKACSADNPEHEMFAWISDNITAELKNGLDFVFFSYYEDDCEGVTYTKEQWHHVFTRLHTIFPHAKLGFGEIGTTNTARKKEYMQRYYSITFDEEYYVGGYFWWYYKQDCVPKSQALWDVLETIVVQTVTPGTPTKPGRGLAGPAVNLILLFSP